MITIRPATLEGHGVRLEPLALEHRDALAAAAADGRLWELWFTSVPDSEWPDVKRHLEVRMARHAESPRPGRNAT